MPYVWAVVTMALIFAALDAVDPALATLVACLIGIAWGLKTLFRLMRSADVSR